MMNLRQQFFWKVLIGLSSLFILFFIYTSYSKYSEYNKYKKEYEKELEVKENKDMQRKADFITNKQDSRLDLIIQTDNIIEESITNHVRAGIKANAKSGWASNEPVYKGMVGNNALIDYRESKGKRYKVNNNIEGTDMVIESFSRDSVVIKYSNGDLRAFYLQSYEQIKK
mgnify:CR=1 FL=1